MFIFLQTWSASDSYFRFGDLIALRPVVKRAIKIANL